MRLYCRLKTEKAVLSTCKVITGLQIISWLPIIVVNVGSMTKLSPSYKQEVLAVYILNIFATIAPLSDPLVCIFRLKNFKQSIKHLFGIHEVQ